MNNTDKKQKIFAGVILVLILGVVGLAFVRKDVSTAPGAYDSFATCLKDKGAIFYGAFWCPHCQAQKKMFGTSAKLLPYVECSTPDGRGSTQLCQDKKIDSYPTWELADGTRIPVESSSGVSLATLAAKTSCELPNQQQ